jgi:hypothetical protein
MADKFSDKNNMTHTDEIGELFFQGEDPQAFALLWLEKENYWGTSLFHNHELDSMERFVAITKND